MGKIIDIKGMSFGRLTVVGFAGIKHHKAAWSCVCECGNKYIAIGKNLRNGSVKSCGCLKTERISRQNLQHGLSGTVLFKRWIAMRRRCYDTKEQNYKYYGGRGISVCKEWSDFQTFYDWSIANGYKDGLSIDRIDSNGNYEPENCRWVERSKQAGNTRRNLFVTFRGETHTVAEWSRISGISYGALHYRARNGFAESGRFLDPVQKRER